MVVQAEHKLSDVVDQQVAEGNSMVGCQDELRCSIY
jgi:hypothetical protein